MAESCDVLLVDDDTSTIDVLGHILQELGDIRFATSGSEALRLARAAPPNAMLLDLSMPGMSGFEVISVMKATAPLDEVPIICLTSSDKEEDEVRALSLGAVDFISKPPRPAQVLARVRLHLRMGHMNEALRKAAATDPLTGLANRRQFDAALEREWLRSQRTHSPIALLMIDLDYFKAYNDHFGHLMGDQCLQSVAHAIRSVVHRPTDVAARYGGEEFAVLLPDTNSDGARAVARYLVHAVQSLQLTHPGSCISEHVTLSVGVASQDEVCASRITGPRLPQNSRSEQPSATALVDVADRALYAAKFAGRNHARWLAMHDACSPERAVDLRDESRSRSENPPWHARRA